MHVRIHYIWPYDNKHTYHSPSDCTASVSKTDQGESAVSIKESIRKNQKGIKNT